MAKTQKEIMNALLGALEKGEGSLSDLEALMDRVKKDIEGCQDQRQGCSECQGSCGSCD